MDSHTNTKTATSAQDSEGDGSCLCCSCCDSLARRLGDLEERDEDRTIGSVVSRGLLSNRT